MNDNAADNSNKVLISMSYPDSTMLVIQPCEASNLERIWLNREQALHLLSILPEWINKLPVSLEDKRIPILLRKQ